MAFEYIKSMKAIQKEGPYLVGGWSYGGLIAYEIARQLVQQKDEVSALILMDTSAHIEEFRKIDIDDEKALYSELLGFYNINPFHNYQELPPKERLLRFLECGNQRQGTIEKRGLNHILSIVKSNYRALQKFSITPIKDVPLVLLKPVDGPPGPNDLGWAQYVDTLHIEKMPGNHWGIMHDKLSEVYAHTIQKSIEIACKAKSLVTAI